MGTGMSKVVDGLYLGNIRDAEDRENLAKNGITHILSVHSNAKPVLEIWPEKCKAKLLFPCLLHPWKRQCLLSGRGFPSLVEEKKLVGRNLILHPDVYFCGSAETGIMDMTYLCISASDSSNQNLMQHFKECIRFVHECRLHKGGCLIHCLAGVSRSTTILVAYLMTVTKLGWEECLAATKAVRSYVSPNFGFQQQLQEYEATLLNEYRAWIQQEFGKNPLRDQEELQHLLSQQEEKVREQQAGLRESSWICGPSSANPRPYNAYASSSSSHRWMNR
ncbi:dual specificity protein phosphatase 22-A-like isoform X2 [Hemicordylus capensis]|uniref:dual specificity protein phosphatase 22-A-like isoform X2 n=1 Tax=Hemicordylus capensis TaxID=884348 RepID=UPI0023049439|nr:dual specificity protein phosphatase 22-A-like isoform X2 [Hemicordylus capensis]XP_053127573.1 dual specificity protein phosphatase 22-A-like isoform X2 [Hemicordylus capensis]XP_053127574.1 dual specificity protein phosphatase 22-A-like isoform X2 [Hemicordylus capensis]